MRRSARGTIFGGVGEEDYDSRDGTPAEGDAGFPLGDVKRRSIEVRLFGCLRFLCHVR